jgi:hypothetical protein
MKKLLVIAVIITLFLVPHVMAVEEAISASVTINEFIDVTLTDTGDSGFSFGDVEPATTINVDIYHRGDDYAKGTDEISIDNMKWNEINSPGDSITSTYSLIMGNIGIGDYDIYYWLDIPSAQYAGNYNTTIYIKAVETGISP